MATFPNCVTLVMKNNSDLFNKINNIKYHFMTQSELSTHWGTNITAHYNITSSNLTVANTSVRNAFITAIDSWKDVVNITRGTTEDSLNDANVLFIAVNGIPDRHAGYAVDITYNSSHPLYGKKVVVIDVSGSTVGDFSVGSAGYHYMVHEIGHTLGIEHPFAEESKETTDKGSVPLGTEDVLHSIMSYNYNLGTANTFISLTPQIYDIGVANEIHGNKSGVLTPKTARTGNTEYTVRLTSTDATSVTLTNTSGSFVINTNPANTYKSAFTIYDMGANNGNGGTDTINLIAAGHRLAIGTILGGNITMVDGCVSYLGGGINGGASNAQAAFGIGYGVQLENLKATEGADRVMGNDLNNEIWGNGGDDIINGANGSDTVYGGAGNDVLDGGNGSDQLIGGIGADTMSGGDGSDIYEIDNIGDRIIENANQGIDFVNSSVSVDVTMIGDHVANDSQWRKVA